MASANRRASGKRRRAPRARGGVRPGWALLATEAASLFIAALVAVIAVLGRTAPGLTGGSIWGSLLPFASLVLGLAFLAALLLWGWLAARRALPAQTAWAPALVAGTMAGAALWYVSQMPFQADVTELRTLLGGRQEAERRTIAHQVFAAYRRTPTDAWTRMLDHSATFESDVLEAARSFAVDPEVLMGVAAAESGFAPRNSADGGRGLFQITAAPRKATQAARAALGVDTLDVRQQRHNSFLAAATLHDYLIEMNGDLFLALLAYNIGPSNGGLRAIMHQYGARDFVTIQPYLQNLPRDYPIRVLSAALAYRLWRREGKLPRYEEGDNAAAIQRLGVPGLD